MKARLRLWLVMGVAGLIIAMCNPLSVRAEESVSGDFLYAENLEEARLMVIGGQGFMPVEGVKRAENFGSSISRIPLFRGDSFVSVLLIRISRKSN